MIHKQFKYLKLSGVIVFFSLTQFGCEFPLPKGHYEGNLTQLIGSKPITQPVSLDISKDKHTQNVEVKDAKLKTIFTFEIRIPEHHRLIKTKTFELVVPSLSATPFSLTKKKNCFVSASDPKADFKVHFCYENQNFSIAINDQKKANIFTLTADLFTKEDEIYLEKSVNIALPDAVTRALQKNFQARIEFEKSFQASKGAEEQYLNLLPHFNINTIANGLSATLVTLPTTLLASVGDLAPFLLPNRWLLAKEAGDVGKATEMAQILMQTNIASQVEGIAYVFERDRKILFMLGQLIDWLTDLGKKIQTAESKGLLPAGSNSAFQLLLAKVEQEGAQAESVLQVDRFLFSETLGYINPEAIGIIEIGEESLPIDQASDLDPTQLWQVAVNRSFEIKQLDYLIEAAHDTKNQVYFSWLDPQADSHANVGVAMAPRVEISNSRIKELQVAREQMQATLIRQSYEVINSYNSALHTFQYSEKVMPELEKAIFDQLTQVTTQAIFDCKSLQTNIENFLSQKIAEETNLATFRIARSKIDRLLLQGFYTASYDQFLSRIYHVQEASVNASEVK